MGPITKLTIVGAATALASAAPLALAAPSGGGGASMGGGAPSSSREDPQAAYQAGVAALNAQNYREAIRQFRTARRAVPDNGVINYALGRAYVGNNQDDEARNAFERAIEDNSAPVGAWLELGRLHLGSHLRLLGVLLRLLSGLGRELAQ